MGAAIELVAGRATNPGATLTGLTFNTGNSGTVRSFPFDSSAWLMNAWAQGATAGTLRIRSPRLHDNVQGIRANYLASDPSPLLGREIAQRLYPQDTLIVEISGGGAETDAACLLVYYPNLPGADARLFTWDQIKPRVRNILTIETQHTTGGTAGQWGGGLALNANFDLLKANVDYAIIGYVASAAVNAVRYTGPDTGNLGVGGPGTTTRIETRDWFKRISEEESMPAIPVFNAANKGGTTVDLSSTAAGASVTVDTIVAELAGT